MTRHALVFVLILSSIACSFRPALRAAHFTESDGEYSLATYLRSSNVPLRTSADSSIVLENTSTTREALLRYLRMTMTRREVISNNIANLPTIRDYDTTSSTARPPRYGTPGQSYQRQRVIVDERGVFSVATVPRGGDARFRRYDPMHPDGNADGFVEYPEIDAEIEMIDLSDARKKYELAVTLIRDFAPMCRIPNWDSFDEDARSPANAYAAPSGSLLNSRPPVIPL